MAEILQTIKSFEMWIYFGLGVLALINLRKLVLALQEWRGTVFGLERENAQRRISESVSILILLFCSGLVLFFVNTFVTPGLPLTQPLSTPTLSLLTTITPTLGATSSQTIGGQSLAATQAVPASDGCIKGQVELTFPLNGAVLGGVVNIKGTIKVNNFGFYKYEYAPNGSTNWATIAAGHQLFPPDSILGSWDTTMLVPGDYQLRLVVEDNGKLLPACVVSIIIIAPSATP